MNGLQRVVAAVGLQPSDKVPALPQVFGQASRLAGLSLQDYVTSGASLARGQMAALERYDHDGLFTVMDVCVETEACGSALVYYPQQYPDVRRYALTSIDDLAGLPVPDPAQAGRMPQMLEALSILRAQTQGEVALIGCVMGPMTLATQLLGTEAALFLAVDEPPAFERLIDYAAEVAIRFGVAQIAAGAHLPVVFEPAGSPAVVPPAFFREIIAPRLTRLFGALKAAGGAANWLHIAGPAAPILGYYPGVGANIANFDYEVTPEQALGALPTTCLDGNIRPLAFVDRAPEQIYADCRALVERFKGRGGLILSSGCEIPPEARPENVAALVAAARA